MGSFFGAGLERAWQRRCTAGKDTLYWYISKLPNHCYWILTMVLHAVPLRTMPPPFPRPSQHCFCQQAANDVEESVGRGMEALGLHSSSVALGLVNAVYASRDRLDRIHRRVIKKDMHGAMARVRPCRRSTIQKMPAERVRSDGLATRERGG